MGKHLVLVGGGHAHMVTLANLHTFVEKGHRVTVIGPSAFHYYSGMGPGMLGGTYTPNDIRFATQHVVEKKGGTFLLGKAASVQADEKTITLESGESVSYDVISFNAGSYVPRLNIAQGVQDVYSVKPIERLMQARERILELSAHKKITVGILGGGPSAAEIAGNLWQLTSRAEGHRPDIHIFAGLRFMARYPENVRQKVENSLVNRGIRILIDGYVQSIEDHRVVLDTGQAHDLDVIFLAMVSGPTPFSAIRTCPRGLTAVCWSMSFCSVMPIRTCSAGATAFTFRNSPWTRSACMPCGRILYCTTTSWPAWKAVKCRHLTRGATIF